MLRLYTLEDLSDKFLDEPITNLWWLFARGDAEHNLSVRGPRTVGNVGLLIGLRHKTSLKARSQIYSIRYTDEKRGAIKSMEMFRDLLIVDLQ